MKRIIVGAVVVGLVAGSLVAPAAAKKKKKKKPKPVAVEQDFFLRSQPDPACSEDGKFFLSTTTAEDGSGSCGNLTYGIPLELLIQAGQADAVAAEYVFPAADGIPVQLDATKPLTGLIGVSSYRGAAENPGGLSGGQATLEILIEGTTADGPVTLGTTTVDYLVNPAQQTYEVEFEIEVDPALDKKVLESLALSLRNRGATVMHGYYTVDNPDSYIRLGTWQLP